MFAIKFVIFNLNTWKEYGDFGWLGVRYILSELKKAQRLSLSVNIIDEANWREGIAELLAEKPDLVAIPAIQQNLKLLQQFCRSLKQENNAVRIAVGNLEATLRPVTLMEKIPEIDFAVMGEGEYTFREAAERLRDGRGLSDCKGVCYRSGAEILVNEQRELESKIDKFAFPERELFPSKHRVYDIIASRGCRGHCTFCANKSFYSQPGPRLRSRSLDNMMREIEDLIHNQHASYISISDDTFGDNSCSGGFDFKDFLAELKARKIYFRYRIQLRSECVTEESVQSLVELRKFGLDNILIGFEAGNKPDLKLYGKIASLQDNFRALELLNRYRLPYSMGFIMFNPYSTVEKLKANIDFIKQGKNILSSYIFCSRLRLFNGADILKKVEKDGLIISDIQDKLIGDHEYRFVHPEIEQIWNAFSKMETLPINFVVLDQLDSYFKFMADNGNVVARNSQTKQTMERFYESIEELRASYLSYADAILNYSSISWFDDFANQQFTRLQASVSRFQPFIDQIVSRLGGAQPSGQQ